MSLTAAELAGLTDDAHVLDADGRRLGRVRHIYDSDQAGELTWVSINPDGPGRRSRFVPLQGARLDGSDLRLAYAGELIDKAPEISDDEEIDSTEEGRLRTHYGLHSGSVGGGGGATMIRSEERLTVDTVVEAVERVRVTKYIVTEEVTHTFTLRREEIRVEHLPLDGPDATGAVSGAAFDDGVEEIVLYAEVPVLEPRVVPVEIVRISKHTVTGGEQFSASLQREQIEVEHSRPSAP